MKRNKQQKNLILNIPYTDVMSMTAQKLLTLQLYLSFPQCEHIYNISFVLWPHVENYEKFWGLLKLKG